MTIAIGLVCRDSVVLCADRQMTSPTGYKYYQDKIKVVDGGHWVVAVAYAGHPRPMQEATDKIEDSLRRIPEEEISVPRARDTIAGVLKGMGRLNRTDHWLQLLIAAATIRERPKLFFFNTLTLEEAENDSPNCIGVGDSALIRFLFASLYRPVANDVTFARNLGIYLVKQAKEHIDGCGGGTNVAVLHDLHDGHRWEWFTDVQGLESQIDDSAKQTWRDFSLRILGAGGE